MACFNWAVSQVLDFQQQGLLILDSMREFPLAGEQTAEHLVQPPLEPRGVVLAKALHLGLELLQALLGLAIVLQGLVADGLGIEPYDGLGPTLDDPGRRRAVRGACPTPTAWRLPFVSPLHVPARVVAETPARHKHRRRAL